jgi:hypothetical protein
MKVPGIGMGALGPGWYKQLTDWEQYLAEAQVLGYSEREAKLTVKAVEAVARQTPYNFDVLAEAKRVLAVGPGEVQVAPDLLAELDVSDDPDWCSYCGDYSCECG